MDVGWLQAGKEHDELVASHPGHMVVLAARGLKSEGDRSQHLIAFQVSETIVDLLEAVQIQHQHGQRHAVAMPPGKFRIELQEQGARVGESREIIRRGR